MAYDDDDDDDFGEEGNQGPVPDFIYMLDAENKRQYAIFVDPNKGTMLTPLAFDENGKRAQGQVFNTLAYNDQVFYQVNQDGKGGTITAQATFINGTSILGRQATFDWKVDREKHADGKEYWCVKYEMQAESFAELKKAGFPARTPRSYTQATNDPVTKEENTTLRFPPNHPDGANASRDYISRLSQAQFDYELQKLNEVKMTPDNMSSTSPAAGQQKKMVHSDADLEKVLSFFRDVSALAAAGKLEKVVGRDAEVHELLITLNNYDSSWAAVTGEAGVGKTVMIDAVAQHLHDSGSTDRVLKLNMDSMIAGTKYRGEFEKRLQIFTEGLAERNFIFKGHKIIIGIDEMHQQMAVNGGEGANSVGNKLKAFFLEKGGSGIATTTDEEYDKHIANDSALDRRFKKHFLPPPNEVLTASIVKGRYPSYQNHHKLTEAISDETVQMLISKSKRLMPNRAFPTPVLEVLDDAGSRAQLDGRTTVTQDDYDESFAKMAKLPIRFVQQSDGERLAGLEGFLKERILGQPAVSNVADTLIGAGMGLANPKQPQGAFLLLGPTRVGKTETARVLEEYLMGSDGTNMIKLDMGEFQQQFSASRIIGSPPGYVGYDDKNSLVDRVRRQPYSVILLDEIEKAHPDIADLFLSILDEGELTDSHGKKVSFKNTIFVMTSNLAARDVMDILQDRARPAGMGSGGEIDQDEVNNQVKGAIDGALKKAFKPEFLNRIRAIGGVFVYNALTQDVVNQILKNEIKSVEKNLNSPAGANIRNVSLEVTDKAMAQLLEDGYELEFGAGPIKDIVRSKVINPLAKFLLGGRKAELQQMVAEHGGAKITLDDLREGFKVEKVSLKAAFDSTANDNKTPAAEIETPKNNNPRLLGGGGGGGGGPKM